MNKKNTTTRWEGRGARPAAVVICLAMMLATCAQPPTLLEEVLALGELRAVTRIGPTTYYTGVNGPEGPEYDLVRGFAAFLGVELELQTADRITGLIPAVETGGAHVVAAGLTITPERSARVNFGPAYDEVKQYVIYKRGSGRPRNFDDLGGKKFEVASGTSHVDTLSKIQIVHPTLVWTENPNTDLTELLLGVATQEIDYTVADSNLFRVYRNYLPEIRVGFEIDRRDSLAWAFPKRRDRSLIERAEQYFEHIKRNGDLDRLTDRYYRQVQRFDYVRIRRFIRHYRQTLPRFRRLFETMARENQIDWRLLAAIGYQESHWDPLAISPTGVRGIMMLTKKTAVFMGIEDRVDPAQSIEGGAAYFARIRRRLPAIISEPDRTWFALAAYNIGYGHLEDARNITRRNGGDPDSWIHVNKSLPLLAQPEWFTSTAYGYARGWEPVKYVENIRDYYDILIWLTNGSAVESEPEEILAVTIAQNDIVGANTHY